MSRPRWHGLAMVVRVWRWRRVCWRGVVMASRHHPHPDGVAYTWSGACVGNATRGYLAHALSRAEQRRRRAAVMGLRWSP